MEDLKFQVTADTSQAVSAMDRLASSLTKLRTVSNTFNATTLAGQINRINEALNNVNVGKTRSFAQAMNGLKSAMKGDQWGRVEYEIRSIANFLKEVDVTKADALSKSLRALTGANGSDPDSMKQSAENVRLFGEAMKTIGDSGAFVKAVNALTRAANITEFTLADKVRELSAAINEMDADKLMAVAEAAKGLKTVSRQISPNLSEQTVGNDAGGSYNPAPVYTDPSAATAQISTLDQYLANLEARLSGAWGWIKSFGIELGKAASAAVPFVKTIAQLPMLMGSKLAAQVKSVTSALGGLIHQFARIAVIKAIRGLISSITKSFQEGVKALYEYSSAMGTTFAGSMDMLATSANYLSNSLAAMAAPIYNALAPALDFLVDKIVVVMNWINMLFAALGGATTTTIAKKTATAFNNVGGSAGNAGSGAKKAAKELKRFILAFDEINALGSQNSGSGSGGGGGGAGGGGLGGYDYFEEAAINQTIRDIADTIKAYIGAEEWEKLGRFLGDGVNQAIEMVPWAEAGERLGRALRGVIDTTYYFLDEIKWVELGGHIADFFNNAISNVNWENLGRILVKRWTLLFDMVIGFVQNLDTFELGNAIGDFIEGLYKEATKWLNSVNWVEFGETIVKKLVDLFNGLDIGRIASAMFEYLGTVFRSALGLLAGIIAEASNLADDIVNKIFDFSAIGGISGFVYDNIIDPFLGALLGETWDKAKEVGKKLGEKIKEGIKQVSPNLYEMFFGKSSSTGGKSDVLYPGETTPRKYVPGTASVPKTTGKSSMNAHAAATLGGFAFSTAITTGAWLQKLLGTNGNFTGTGERGASVIGALNKIAPQFANKWATLVGKGTQSGLVGGVDAFADTNPDVPMKALIKDYDDQIVNNRLTFLAMLYNFADRIGNKDLKNFIAQLAMTEDLLPSTEKRVPGIVALMQHTEDLLSPQERAIKNFVAEITGKKDHLSDKSFSGFTAKFTSSHDGLSTGAKTFGSKANFTSSKDSLSASERTISATAKITTVLKPSKNPTINVNGKIVAAYKEMGGALYGGGWHNIPQYARGTLNAGSLFIAGERGPEAIGHIGGRTEVLNASQLASVMYASVVAGVAQLVPAMNAISYNIVEGANGIIASQIETAEYSGEDNGAQQLELLREMNDVLHQILDKDNSVEITTTSLTSAFNRKNQRDGKTIIPVGT